MKARNIYDFDEINFNIPASVKDGATLLTLTEGSTDLSSTKVNANISGDTINLISNENGLPTSGTVSRGTDRIIDWLPPKELKETVAYGESIVEVISNKFGIFANLEGSKLKIKTGGGIDLGFVRTLEDSRGDSAETDFSSNNLLSSYNAGTPVFAGHLRSGRFLRINKNNLLHYYGIYSHNLFNGFGADLSSGEHYDFDSVDSGKFRIGYRLTTRVSNLSKLYTELAYQYEFNGNTSAKYKDFTTAESKVKGSSEMLELG